MRYLLFVALLSAAAGFAFAAHDTDFTMNSAVLQEKKEGIEIWKKPDGTVITVYGDRTEAKLPDGTRIVKFNDGRRESYSPDGTKVIVDEAKGVREYDRGGKRATIDFSGMTPFGEKISPVEKKILKEPMIRIVYLPEQSDELLYPGKTDEKIDWEIRDFFDSIYDQLRQKYINDAQKKKMYSGKPFDIRVSFCKYCKTGYCFGKEKAVTVEFLEEGKIIKRFVFESARLRNKDKLLEDVKTVVDFASER
jgi:hypothetical protein